MKSLKTAKNLEGKVVLVRGSLNVPISQDGTVEDDFRLKALFPTLNFLVEQKAKIVLLGHLGRDPENTLKPVFKYLKEKYDNLVFDKNTFRDFNSVSRRRETKKRIANLKNGEILLLDNLRQDEREKENDSDFKKQLITLGDVYIQDAFSVSHREHASMTVEPDFFGLQYEKEIKNLNKVLQPESPSIFILGGAKIQTKIPLLEQALEKYDQVIVGGAIANTFYQHLSLDIGDSLVEKVDGKVLDQILMKDNFILPDPDLVIWDENKILDIAPEFFENMRVDFENAKFIFLNGPMGYYEGGFTTGTEKVLELSASPDNFFLTGGGNTASLIFKLGLEKNTDFISTGGGALIDFLTKK